MVTDKLRSYAAAKSELMPGVEHRSHRGLNTLSADLIVAALLAGSGQLGGLTLIGLHVPGNHRAKANAVLNIGGYIPAGLMHVATGLVIDHAGLSRYLRRRWRP
ncbi:hypothetical protein thsrh120_60620 [Rhizobium sp. No.120]